MDRLWVSAYEACSGSLRNLCLGLRVKGGLGGHKMTQIKPIPKSKIPSTQLRREMWVKDTNLSSGDLRFVSRHEA